LSLFAFHSFFAEFFEWIISNILIFQIILPVLFYHSGTGNWVHLSFSHWYLLPSSTFYLPTGLFFQSLLHIVYGIWWTIDDLFCFKMAPYIRMIKERIITYVVRMWLYISILFLQSLYVFNKFKRIRGKTISRSHENRVVSISVMYILAILHS
jgi:hypothetical protein